MKTFFRKERCPQCGDVHDAMERRCPKCGHADPQDRHLHDFEHQIRAGFPWQIAFFLSAWAGLQTLATVVMLIIRYVFLSTHSGATGEDADAFLMATDTQFAVNVSCYATLAVVLLLLLHLSKRLVPVFKSFADWKAGIAGVVGFGAIFAITLLYGLAITAIFTAAGAPVPDVNENQATLERMIHAFPVLSIVAFGIVGPFCEEVGYRIGLYGFLSRVGKPLAYLVATLVFGLIHFNWDCLFGGDTDAIIAELVNLPSYLGAGAGLCFLYDRFGFGASFTAHSINNLVSIIQVLVLSKPS